MSFVGEFIWCFVRTVGNAIRVAASGGSDILHLCNPPETFWPLAFAWRLVGKRVIFDHHDLSPEMYGAKFDRPSPRLLWGPRFMEWMTFRSANVVLATNESHRRIAPERGGVPVDEIFVVRSGPDLTRLRYYPPGTQWRGAAGVT